MRDASHPIWSLARLVVLMVTLTVTLMLTASQFDGTEIRTIVVTFVAGAGVEGVGQFLRSKSDRG